MAAFLRRLSNLINDWLLGVSTRGTEPAERDDAVYYASVDYSDTRDVLRRLALKDTDVFADIGSGKGRVVCLASRMSVRKVLGVECSPKLSRLARANVRRMRGRRAPAEIHTVAAEEFDYSGVSAAYLFNPFEANVLDTVLHKMRSDRAGRSVTLAFVMESPAQRGVFDAHSWLVCRRRWTDGAGHPVAIYQSRDEQRATAPMRGDRPSLVARRTA